MTPSDRAALRAEPLRCEIDGERLVISLGLDTLMVAARYSPYVDRTILWDDAAHAYDESRFRITDAHAFAAEILSELEREEEDGTTPVHTMLDAAIQAAIENGCEGVEISE